MFNLLRNDFGVKLFPKSDGRITVPKKLSRLIEEETVYACYDDGIIFVSNNPTLLSKDKTMTIAVSGGRLRIPLSIIKLAELDDKELVAFYDGQDKIILRENNVSFLKKMLKIETSIRVAEVEISEEELLKSKINNKIDKPDMFLLSKDEVTVFRPIGNPYCFSLCWQNGKPLLAESDEDTATVYAIAGFKRLANKQYFMGFLLIDEDVAGQIKVLIRGGVKINKCDLIFIGSHGKIKVSYSPNEKLDTNLINQVKLACSDPENFLLEHFGIYECGECERPPSKITDEVFNNYNIPCIGRE